jgi:hypothetical protein
VFDVASRPAGLPVQVDGVAWWYEADSLIAMPEEVRRSIYAENGFDFSGEICRSLTLAELDEKAVSVFRKTWVDYSGNKRIATLSAVQLLRDCGAMTDADLTYAVREAKALPDFKGTDAYFVKLTLNGQVVDKRILTMFHKVGKEILEKMTTEDFILISRFYNKNELADIDPMDVAHLVQLGIIGQTDSGLKLKK